MRKISLFLPLVILLLLLWGCSAMTEPSMVSSPMPEMTVSPEPVSTVTPMPTPTVTPEPTATPEPTPTPTPVPTPFSIVWLTDTQSLAYHDSPLLHSLGKGIDAFLEAGNVAAVVHTGDIVDNGFKSWQWENIDKTFAYFEGKVPFFPIAGNHDMGVNKGSYAPFLQTRYLSDIPAEQKFKDGIIYYTYLDAGGTRLLLLCASFDALRDRDVHAWLDPVMEENKDIPCILLTHGYLTPKMPNKIVKHNRVDEQNIVSRYPNIRLILCGHVGGYVTAAYPYDDNQDGTVDRTVNALMINYTEREYYAYRVLTFDPVLRTIDVKTYSADPDTPVKDDVEHYGPIDFTLENAF